MSLKAIFKILFFETSHLQIDTSPNEHTSGSDGRQFLRQDRATKIALVTFAQAPVRYLGNTVEPGSQNYAGLLNPPVRVKQSSTHSTDAGLHGLTDHLFEPTLD